MSLRGTGFPAAFARGSRSGFTLLEILVAVVIGGSLLIAAVFFAFSMGELWGNGSEVRLFDQHVRGVTRFMQEILRQAEAPPVVDAVGNVQAAEGAAGAAANAGQPVPVTQQAAPVQWQEPRGAGGSDELLTFQLAESPGIFTWPEAPLPFVVAAIRVDPRRGLFLLWKSRLEIDFADDAPRELRVSPFVTGISYLYYDPTEENPEWEETDRPRSASGQELEVPARLRLHFEYQGLERWTDLVLPQIAAGVPVY